MFIDHVGDIQGILTLLLAYVLAITPAGWFRAYIAEKLGDDTAERLGFLSLNPIDHFDPIGFTFLVFSRYISSRFIIGWGRHVPINGDNFIGPYARLKYMVAVCSDVFMHLLMATGAMAMLAFIFDQPMQMLVYHLALNLLFTGTTPAALNAINIHSLIPSFTLSIGYVLSVFFYLNIFFAIISLLSTIIMNVMAFLLTRFDVERYYLLVLLGVMVIIAMLGSIIGPLFESTAVCLGNKCATLFKA